MTDCQPSPQVRVAKNAAFLVSADVVSKFANLAFFVVLARILGDTGLGQYTFAISLGSLFAILTHFGLNNFTVRELAARPEQEGLYLGNLLSLKFVLAVVSLGLLFLATRWMRVPPELAAVVLVVGVTLLVSTFNTFLMCFFRARERMEYEAVLTIGERFLKAGVGILVLLVGSRLLGMTLGILGAGLLSVLVTGEILSRRFARPRLGADFDFWRTSLRLAAPFFALAAFQTLYFRIDAVMLTLMKGEQVVGWYGASYKLLDVFIFLPVAFAGALLPAITRARETGDGEETALASRSSRVLLILALPVAGAVSALADRVLTLIYGAGFEPGVLCLRVLIWTLVFRFLTPLMSSVLIACREQTRVLWIVIFGACFNIILNLILIPRYSLVGAAAASLTGEAAILSLQFWFVRRAVGTLPMGRTVARAGLATAGLVLFCRLAGALSLVWLVPLGIVLYAAILAGLRELNAEDLRQLRALLQHRRFDGPEVT